MSEHLSKFLQENIVALLLFDDTASKLISSVVTHSYFDGVYSDIVKRAMNYIEQYKQAPKEHIADLFSDILEGDNKQKKDFYSEILFKLKDSSSSINNEYVINSLMAWLRHQELKLTIIECGRLFQNSDQAIDEIVAEAENILQRGIKKQQNIFSPGIFFGSENSFGFLDEKSEAFPTGILELDKYHCGPARGELYVQIGLAGSGKTMGLIHIAKACLLRRLKVCHVSLEMSEDKMLERYYQSFYGIPKRYQGPSSTNGKHIISQFETDTLQRVTGLKRTEVNPKIALEDPDIRAYLNKNISVWGGKMKNLVVKQFPDGSLTMPQLRAYLDGLENHFNYVPDVLILDYVDKMKFDPKNYRHEVSQLYSLLRGLGVERNLATITATQSNRAGKSAKMVDTDNVAESWDKIAIADTVVTYSQTSIEKSMGTARLYVGKNRNDMDGQVIVITQNYAFGQYCLTSLPMLSPTYYINTMKQVAEEEGISSG